MHARRWPHFSRIQFVVACLIVGVSTPALAFEFLDGDLEIHGFYEAQVRVMGRDLDPSDDLDLAQWWNVLNVEVEWDVAPDGVGPFDLVSLFARVEVRYDCVWTRACGIFSSADTYGDRARKLPKRLSDGRRGGYRNSANIFNGDLRYFRDIPRAQLPITERELPSGSRRPSPFFNIGGIDTLYDNSGVNGVFGDADDPAPFYFSRQEEDCVFGFEKRKGSEDGVGTRVLGPWNPSCKIHSVGALADRPNPFRPGDRSPLTGGTGGTAALPLRPAPENGFLRGPLLDTGTPLAEARGVYYPNAELARMIRQGKFDSFDQNFRQEELAWNRGASQQDEKELKELFFDFELFDSRLWIRAGRQSIVWGKTEIFRNQDQWNPVDLALASLPALEEARIALWSVRGVWSFWDAGPLEDLRLELAFNFDQFEPTDLGRCGEPYSPLAVCDKTFGLFIHGLTGLGVAGEVRPPNPWNSWKGIEAGARVEARWDRFSFALTEFYGYTDMPYQEQLFVYSRNVDPKSGRPRHTMATGDCRTGNETSCLSGRDALTQHSANQQLFAMVCGTSIGFSSLDPTVCGLSVFNSQNIPNPAAPTLTVSAAVGNLLGGDATGAVLPGLLGVGALPFASPLVGLNADPADPLTNGIPNPSGVVLWGAFALEPFTTPEQQALLGCGPFYESSCDRDGIDLLNTEFTAIAQSWPGIEGTFGFDWDTTDGSTAQPGTIGFEAGPLCTRYTRDGVVMLPGCRGPGDDGYDPRIDGTPPTPGSGPFAVGNAHPFTGQAWRSEIAAISWNALVGLAALSSPVDPANPAEDEFDVTNAFRADGCSLRKPFLCGAVQAIWQLSGLQRNVTLAGGNARFGRRDFAWHGGTPFVLRYSKRNILGFSMDWAEDVTKSNWSIELTWEDDVPFQNRNAFDGLATVDTYNLTISVDRPTFINFLNPNRTFFINSQWFIRYVDDYRDGFTTNGPWTVLGTLTIQTGFFRDRFRPNMTFVYDFASNSGAFLPSLEYRYTGNFSVTFGLAMFWGRSEARPMALRPSSLSNRVGRHAYKDFVDNGVAPVRERDEMFLRIRYTF